MAILGGFYRLIVRLAMVMLARDTRSHCHGGRIAGACSAVRGARSGGMARVSGRIHDVCLLRRWHCCEYRCSLTGRREPVVSHAVGWTPPGGSAPNHAAVPTRSLLAAPTLAGAPRGKALASRRSRHAARQPRRLRRPWVFHLLRSRPAQSLEPPTGSPAPSVGPVPVRDHSST